MPAGKPAKPLNTQCQLRQFISPVCRVFSHDVIAVMLVDMNKGMAARGKSLFKFLALLA